MSWIDLDVAAGAVRAHARTLDRIADGLYRRAQQVRDEEESRETNTDDTRESICVVGEEVEPPAEVKWSKGWTSAEWAAASKKEGK